MEHPKKVNKIETKNKNNLLKFHSQRLRALEQSY